MDRVKQRLSREKLTLYRQNAKQVLGAGQNLFAEITLRVLASHEAVEDALERLQHLKDEHDLELAFLSKENRDLRDHIAVLERERRQLLQRLAQQEDDAASRKRNNLKLPPSWDS